MAKMLDPKNVIVRKERMMKSHIQMFEEYFGAYIKEGENYCFNTDNSVVKIYYGQSSKLLTKTFSTIIKITIKDVQMSNSWKGKIQLEGFLKVNRIILKELNSNSLEIVSKLNSDKIFTNKLLYLFKDFDFSSVLFEYKKDLNEISISITPYPGAFIWVKIPPIYYNINFRPEEIKRLHEIATMCSEFFTD